MKDSFFTLTFFPRKPRSEGNGEYPIYARITTEGQKTEFTIGRKVHPSNWDQRAQRSAGRSRRDLELNKYLEMVRSRFYEIHNRLLNEGRYINPQIMKNHYFGMVEKPKMLCDVFCETNVKRREEYERGDIGYATFSRWERCVTYLEEFIALTHGGDRDIAIKDVTAGFVQDFEHFLRVSKECANNTAVRYLRYLKNVIQYAIANKWISDDPFLGKRFKRTKADRGFLTEPELKSIMALDLKAFPRLECVRDTFVFCSFTGLAYADLKQLTEDDISQAPDGTWWIHVNRQKTGSRSAIRLLDIPMRIMEKYRDERQDGKIFNLYSRTYLIKLTRQLGKEYGFCLTFHKARHNFGTHITLSMGVPIETVSRMMGHKSVTTTQIYAQVTDRKVDEDMKRLRMQASSAEITLIDESMDKEMAKRRKYKFRNKTGNGL